VCGVRPLEAREEKFPLHLAVILLAVAWGARCGRTGGCVLNTHFGRAMTSSVWACIFHKVIPLNRRKTITSPNSISIETSDHGLIFLYLPDRKNFEFQTAFLY